MQKKMLMPLSLLVFFIVFRLGLDFIFWRNISVYASYAFECVFVGLVWFLYRDQIKLFKFYFKQLISDFLIPILSGFAIYKLAVYSLIPIPFDLKSLETIILLTTFGPILEELIFRMALWEPLKNIFTKTSHVIILSTILFAVGHLQALWFVPESLRSFVIYQTLYVIILGLGAGWRRSESQSLFAPILLHISFNFGFYLASLN